MSGNGKGRPSGRVLLAVLDLWALAAGWLLRLVLTGVVIVIGLAVLRWGLSEYYVSTHCTMVLGTRVCR